MPVICYSLLLIQCDIILTFPLSAHPTATETPMGIGYSLSAFHATIHLNLAESHGSPRQKLSILSRPLKRDGYVVFLSDAQPSEVIATAGTS